VDTAVAHLTGAMGKPVWILLPFAAEWRWMSRREDSPWYPTARLFRQSVAGDWAGLIQGVGDELHRFSPAMAPAGKEIVDKLAKGSLKSLRVVAHTRTIFLLEQIPKDSYTR